MSRLDFYVGPLGGEAWLHRTIAALIGEYDQHQNQKSTRGRWYTFGRKDLREGGKVRVGRRWQYSPWLHAPELIEAVGAAFEAARTKLTLGQLTVELSLMLFV